MAPIEVAELHSIFRREKISPLYPCRLIILAKSLLNIRGIRFLLSLNNGRIVVNDGVSQTHRRFAGYPA